MLVFFKLAIVTKLDNKHDHKKFWIVWSICALLVSLFLFRWLISLQFYLCVVSIISFRFSGYVQVENNWVWADKSLYLHQPLPGLFFLVWPLTSFHSRCYHSFSLMFITAYKKSQFIYVSKLFCHRPIPETCKSGGKFLYVHKQLSVVGTHVHSH